MTLTTAQQYLLKLALRYGEACQQYDDVPVGEVIEHQALALLTAQQDIHEACRALYAATLNATPEAWRKEG